MPDNIWIGDCPAKGPSECAPEYASLWDGLVGLWAPAIGPTGNALFDMSGLNNHGTLTNMDPATDWVGSPYGWALDFAGSGQQGYGVSAGPVNELLLTGRYSVTALFNCFIANNRFYLFQAKTSGNWPGLYLRMYGGRLLFYRNATGYNGRYLGGDEAYADNKWHVVTGVSSARTVTSITGWVDGAEVATEQHNNSGTVAAASTNEVILAQYETAPTAVALIAVHNRVLESSEIIALHADPLGLLRPAGFGAELWYSGGAPPAGSSIPAIYDYYRRLRCA